MPVCEVKIFQFELSVEATNVKLFGHFALLAVIPYNNNELAANPLS